MEIFPKVHLMNRVRGANVFFLNDLITPTLIDSGLPLSSRRIIRSLDEVGVEPDGLKQILLTHHHIDHSGGAEQVRDQTRAQILCHVEDADFLIQRKRRRRGVKLQHGPVPDGFLSEGDILPILGGLEVLHTPGHTPGSLCFYLPLYKAVFVGDLFLHTSDRLSRPSRGATFHQEQYEESLNRVAELDVDACFPAHGPPILSGASEAIKRLRDARGERRSKPDFVGRLRDVPKVIRFGISLFRKSDH
jgi:glyoxylase-like metal-dependent hydrolase (beta-lactamase superfamily II)